MRFIYNYSVYIAGFFLNIIALFNAKLRLFVDGRKDVFKSLKQANLINNEVIWIHTASLGEFEQGLPIIEELKTNYPTHKLIVTFFSPSGYEVKKNSAVADLITYLPLDTKKNAENFIQLANPKLAIFIKYEIWPNYLAALKKHNTHTILASAIFNKKQIFFKKYGGFMRNSLHNFDHFFVQDENSKTLLNNLNFNNVSISGDTRFDRVLKVLEQDNQLKFMEQFKQNEFCVVAGSTWPDDEKIIVEHINKTKDNIKYVFAPHTIKKDTILNLASSINKKTILYSDLPTKNLQDYDVFIIDTIGILTKIYNYADIAYVGGGFATGLHNTLEPAVYSIPVIIGPKFSGFKEAEELVAKKGIISVSSLSEFSITVDKLQTDVDYYNKTRNINSEYISKNQGATKIIVSYIQSTF